tara:strand:- start:141 stop:593 length:453 start_codon:yes stop_codon:yes gene_type:complete
MPIALLQMGMCMWARITAEKDAESPKVMTPMYTSVDTRSDGGMSEMEAGTTGVGMDAATLAYQQAINGMPTGQVTDSEEPYVDYYLNTNPLATLPVAGLSIQGATPQRAHAAHASRGGLSFKLDMGGGSEPGVQASTLSSERLAEIANTM